MNNDKDPVVLFKPVEEKLFAQRRPGKWVGLIQELIANPAKMAVVPGGTSGSTVAGIHVTAKREGVRIRTATKDGVLYVKLIAVTKATKRKARRKGL